MHISQIGAGARVRVVHSLEHTNLLHPIWQYQENTRKGGGEEPFRKFLEMNSLEASFLCKNRVISFDCSKLIS